MPGPFVHRIDPVIAEIAGVYLWWYGLSYTLGFLGVHLWFRRARERLGMTLGDVYGISLYLSVGVLLGGRLVEVVFYEWEYFAAHPQHIPAFWLGGMATHGLLLGAVLGTLLFCRKRNRSFLALADELVIPGAWIMGVGRLGNFIDGQIAGAVTGVAWAVQFPDLAGFRHPVVLYDGLKNILLIPLLLLVRKGRPPRGVLFAHFIFWYAFLRIFIDLFREYRIDAFGLGTGQVINLVMSLLGGMLLIHFHRRHSSAPSGESRPPESMPLDKKESLWRARLLFVSVLLFCLTLPSDWTQDIPARYGHRHPGLNYSLLYPQIEDRLPRKTLNHQFEVITGKGGTPVKAPDEL